MSPSPNPLGSAERHDGAAAWEAQAREELASILEALDIAPWGDRAGETAKSIWFAPSAIRRLRRLLGRDFPPASILD